MYCPPRPQPLAALVSGGDLHAQNTWSIFARPKESVVIPGTLAADEAVSRLEQALQRTPRIAPARSGVAARGMPPCMPVPSGPPSGGVTGVTGGVTGQACIGPVPAGGPTGGPTGPTGTTGQACTTDARTPPFDGGWIVVLGYSLGACFEPRATTARRAGPAPHAVLLWCEDAWCLDHSDGSLHAVGNPPPLEPELGLDLGLDRQAQHGSGPRAASGDATLDGTGMSSADGTGMFSGGADGVADGTGMFRPWKLSRLEPDTSDSHYATSVARVVEYIREGDAFQANIARRFSARIAGDVRTFAHAAITENRAWFGASIDVPTVGGDCDDGSPAGSAGSECLVSMSPELFLRVRPDGTVVTRPIKGTRPSTVDARELAESAKDAAELAMIVDLMRNDLGRIADLGSVRVTTARVLETHRTVHHGVAEISARLRDDVDWTGMLAATFPPGSVTGAPKIRAMQIIEELEPHARGFYCGAIGFISRSGHAALSVAIRTAQIGAARTLESSTGGGAQAHASQPAQGAITADTISAQGGSSSGRERQPCMPVPSDDSCMPVPSDGRPSDDPRAGGFAVRTVTYHAGCGIVADSDPQAEVEETHAKARAIAQLAGR